MALTSQLRSTTTLPSHVICLLLHVTHVRTPPHVSDTNLLRCYFCPITALHHASTSIFAFQHFMNGTEYSCGYDQPSEVYWIRHVDITIGKETFLFDLSAWSIYRMVCYRPSR